MKKIRVLAIACALILAAGLFVVLQKVDKPEENTVNVVVAAADMTQNTIITDEMLTTKAVPEDMVLPNTYVNTEELVGKIAKVDIKAGEQIIADRLNEIGSRTAGNLAMMVEEGKRAITIAVDAVTGLCGMIHPGDMVDVIAHVEKVDEEGKTTPVSLTLVENIPVLAVDSIMSSQGAAEGYSTITLLVTPEQANEIDWSNHMGLLRVILRTPLDEAAGNAPQISVEDITK